MIEIKKTDRNIVPQGNNFACIDCPYSNWKFGLTAKDINSSKEIFFRQKTKEAFSELKLSATKFEDFTKKIVETEGRRNPDFKVTPDYIESQFREESKDDFWKDENNNSEFQRLMDQKNYSFTTCYCSKEFQFTFKANPSEYFHITSCDFKNEIAQQNSNNLSQ